MAVTKMWLETALTHNPVFQAGGDYTGAGAGDCREAYSEASAGVSNWDQSDRRTEIIDAAFFSTELRINPARSQA